MNSKPNKYAFTKSHYFINILNEDTSLDKDLYIKIICMKKLQKHMK